LNDAPGIMAWLSIAVDKHKHIGLFSLSKRFHVARHFLKGAAWLIKY
jgi:transposase-like protein